MYQDLSHDGGMTMKRRIAAAAGLCLAAVLMLPWAVSAAGSAETPASASAASSESRGTARFTVTADILNVRDGPSLDARVIGKLKQGAVVEKLGEEGVWFRIRLGELTGWAHSDHLAPVDDGSGAESGAPPDESASGRTNAEPGKRPDANAGTRPAGGGQDGGRTDAVRPAQPAEPGQTKPKVIGRGIRAASERSAADAGAADGAVRTGHVLGDAVRIRSGPGLDYAIEGHLNRGDRVTVTGSEGEWYSIVTESGQTGWIAAAYVGFRAGADEGPAGSALRGKTIVIDPGHGGNDPGTIGTTYGSYEKTLNLATAIHLKRELELRGASVVMTRATDEEKPSLRERVAIAEQSGGDVFVSIHYNSAAARASGILTFYYSGSKDKPLAAAIERRLADAGLGLESLGLSFGNFHVVRENSLPAVLLELGFLTNPHDEELARTEDYQQAAARAIALGLEDYFASLGAPT